MPTTNNTVSSTLQLLGKIMPNRVSAMTPIAICGLPLEPLEEWSPITWVTNCFLKSNWDL